MAPLPFIQKGKVKISPENFKILNIYTRLNFADKYKYSYFLLISQYFSTHKVLKPYILYYYTIYLFYLFIYLYLFYTIFNILKGYVILQWWTLTAIPPLSRDFP